MNTENFIPAIMLTVFAGLATGIGSLIAYFFKSANKKFLAVSLGFSAGVMIYVSFVEIFQKAKDSLVGILGETQGSWVTVGAFFGGVAVIAIIDKLIPSYENPHEIRDLEDVKYARDSKLFRMGIFVALAIAIHNFPEGFATFLAAMKEPALGIPIAAAIAIHNIPEGISVSVPIYHATGSKRKAFFYSFLSGLAEPAGAIVGYFLLRNFVSDYMFGISFAAIAGVMVFISIDELLPTAQEYGEHHLSIYGLISGMIVMATSLLLFI